MSRLDTVSLLLRLPFGIFMALHGLNKVRHNGLDGTANWFKSIGMKWPRTQARLAAGTEIGAGVLLAAGLLTSLACVAFVALMIVAIATVHWKVGFFIFLPNGGWEYCASIAIVATAIGLLGPMKYSLDHALSFSLDLGVWVPPMGIGIAMCHLLLSYRPTR